MILRCFIYYCGKFQNDTINQTIFGKRICKTSLGKMKTISSHLNAINEHATKFDLVDAWRVSKPDILRYTWCRRKPISE